MRDFGTKIWGKAGMVLGIMVIGGSLVGGIVVAANAGSPPGDEAGPTIPVNGGSEATPDPATPTDVVANETPAEDVDARDETDGADNDPTGPQPAEPRSTPSPLPTCWDESWPGEHPDGIEDCEDRPGDH